MVDDLRVYDSDNFHRLLGQSDCQIFCLIDAALRCEIDGVLPCAMTNHYHAVIYDRVGRYPEFIEHFHKLLARSQNALRGRWENLWPP
ncbi:MAG TPA: hypothetical protein VF469_21460 [Kofleriaceae bacterium]